MASQPSGLRRVCPKCEQELSRSAFYRHQNTPSCCPVGQQILVENEITVRDEATDSPERPDVEDMIEGVESDMECDSGTETIESELEVINIAEPATPATITEPEIDHRPTAIVKAISFFLFFFQLKYQVSDRAISLLLSFIKGLIRAVISLVPSCSAVSMIYQRIPRSLKSLRQTFTSSINGLTEYVVCPKCSTLYEASECSMVSRGVLISRTCTYVEFPNHPQKRRRSACGATLMRKVKYVAAYKLVPVKTFLHNSVIEALKSIVQSYSCAMYGKNVVSVTACLAISWMVECGRNFDFLIIA